jgi:hypothetical protein
VNTVRIVTEVPLETYCRSVLVLCLYYDYATTVREVDA